MGGGSTKDSPKRTQQATEGLIKLNVLTDTDFTALDKTQEHHMMIQIATEARRDESTRHRVELSLVLDRSGSMEGTRLHYAKEAIKEVLRSLAPSDTVHLIAYGSEVSVIFENGNMNNVEALCKQVDLLRTQGCTNLVGGLQEGTRVLLKHTKDDSKTLRRVFLFSDGIANVGVSKKSEVFAITRELVNKGVEVCAFGIGEGFDEVMMEGIADAGHGSFFFIDSPEQMHRYVSAALKGLVGVLARNAKLFVRAFTDEVVIEHLYGNDGSDAPHTVTVRDIKQANKKNVLLRVRVTPNKSNNNKPQQQKTSKWRRSSKKKATTTTTSGATTPTSARADGDFLDALEVTLSYEPFDEQSDDSQQQECKPVLVQHVVAYACTNDAKQCVASNDEVATAVCVQEAAALDEEVQEAIRSKDVVKAKSAKKKEIALLSKQCARDRSGQVQHLLHKANAYGSLLEAEGCTQRAQKWAVDGARQKRRMSMDYMML